MLHPGEMGSAVGAAARSAGALVLWTSEGRSQSSCDRAAAAGLEDAGSIAALVSRSDVVLSVCPPHAAVELARAVAALHFTGLYIDANAISPATARTIGGIVDLVDGGIIGLPPLRSGSTRLYLSGDSAKRAASLFEGSLLEAIPLDAPVGAASALKMAFATWTKGTSALLLAVRALAIAEGVDDALLAEWQRSIPELPARCERAVADNTRKAWRFVGEMEEIAATFADAGLPEGFALAAREVYQRLKVYKNTSTPPSMTEVADAIRKTSTAPIRSV